MSLKQHFDSYRKTVPNWILDTNRPAPVDQDNHSTRSEIFEAVGRLCTEWANIEYRMFETFINITGSRSNETGHLLDWGIMSANTNFDQKKKLVETALGLSRDATEDVRAVMKQVLDDLKTISTHRAKVVHGRANKIVADQDFGYAIREEFISSQLRKNQRPRKNSPETAFGLSYYYDKEAIDQLSTAMYEYGFFFAAIEMEILAPGGFGVSSDNEDTGP